LDLKQNDKFLDQKMITHIATHLVVLLALVFLVGATPFKKPKTPSFQIYRWG